MSDDTEERYNIWRKTDLLFQKSQAFGKFWLEHSKFSKFQIWLVPFVWNMFDLKKV